MALDTKHSRYPHVYAIVRIDAPVDEANPENSVAVVKVLDSKQSAEKETARLNKINAGKNCVYSMCVTRMVRIH